MWRVVVALAAVLFVVGLPQPAAAQTPGVTATNLSAGSTTAVSGHVDTTVTVSGLTSSATYTVTIILSSGLGFDPGTCADDTRRYTTTGTTSVSLPEPGVAQRVYVCASGSARSMLVRVERDGYSSTDVLFRIDATAASTASHSVAIRNLPASMVEGDSVGWGYTLDIETGVAEAVYHVSTEVDGPPAAASLSQACDGSTMTVSRARYGPGAHDAPMYLTACYPAVLVVRIILSEFDDGADTYVRLGAPVSHTVTVAAAPQPGVALLDLAVGSVTAVSESLSTRLTLTGLQERLSYAVRLAVSEGLGYDRGVCADTVRTYLVTGRTTIDLPASPATEDIWVCDTGDAAVRVTVQRAGVGSLVWSFPVAATAAAAPRATLDVSGVPSRISGPVDWRVTVSDLDAEVAYALVVVMPDGLALDVGCTMRTRTYSIAAATQYEAPPGDETLRLQPCATGEHTVLVTLQSPDRDSVRSEVVVTVDELTVESTMEDGLLLRPSIAAIVGARRYGDLVLVVYNVDYPDVAMLPEAAAAWWVDGQVGGRSVASAQAVAQARGGWGHGIVALSHTESLTQVQLTGMPGRYAEPLGVSAPVAVGANLGPDLLLALRGLQAMPEWAGQSLVSGEWLGSDGIAYAEAVIPGLRALAPEIYNSRIVDLASPRFEATLRNDQGILEVEALEGMTGAAARETRLSEFMFRLGLTAIVAIVAAAAAVAAGRSGLLALPAIALVLVGGTIIGFVPLALTLGIGLLSAMILGFALWGKRAG